MYISEQYTNSVTQFSILLYRAHGFHSPQAQTPLSAYPPLVSQLPHIGFLLHKAVGSSNNPARGDDGASADVPPPPVQADLPPPLILSRQRPPDNTPPVADQKQAVCV